jgi:plasmid stability protein
MPAINLPDDLYQRLAQAAARRGQTVDEQACEMLAPHFPPDFPSREERDAAFEKHLELARARAHLYPPGFQLDISRDAMYPDGEE